MSSSSTASGTLSAAVQVPCTSTRTSRESAHRSAANDGGTEAGPLRAEASPMLPRSTSAPQPAAASSSSSSFNPLPDCDWTPQQIERALLLRSYGWVAN
ncbi:hypothetical protein JCM8547_008894 [Rhodosporidiobolus lusitaniae]